MKRLHGMWIVPLMAAMVAVCGGCSRNPASEEDLFYVNPFEKMETDAIVLEWHAMLEDPQALDGSERPIELVRELKRRGDTALTPVVESIGSEELDHYGKLVAVQALAGFLSEQHIDELHALQGEDYDATTRAAATALLGEIPGDKVVPHLRTALNDPEQRVQFAARSGLAQHGDETIRGELRQEYFDDDASTTERNEIVRMLLIEPQPGDMVVLEDALTREDLTIETRINIVLAFSRFGDESSLEALEESIRVVNEPFYEDIAQNTIAAIRQKSGSAGPA